MPSFARLYQAKFPHWAHEPEVLARADQLDDEAVWSAHQEAKRDLIAQVDGARGRRARARTCRSSASPAA